jgi:hypothetical protein
LILLGLIWAFMDFTASVGVAPVADCPMITNEDLQN